jgi:MFS family permease
MNIKRLLLAIVAAYIVLFATDFLIHEKWLHSDYQAAAQILRPEPEMTSRMGWMIGAQVLMVITFVLLWTRWADTARLGCAIGFGLLMGAFSGVWAIVLYVILPMPGALAAKWFFSGIAQSILLALVTFFVYKPAPRSTLR